ncbi:MAG: PPC domain-containing DNA-binding protein [Actinocatenispora sp.]
MPSMRGRMLVVVLHSGEEAVDCLTRAVREYDIRAAQVVGVGGFSDATLGFFEPDKQDYRPIPVPGQSEVVSFLGDVAWQDDEPVLHAHAVLGRADGSTRGGHLLAGTVWPTLEIVITDLSTTLTKRHYAEAGVPLIDLDLPVRP